MRLNIQLFASGTITFTASGRLQGRITYSTSLTSDGKIKISTVLYARRTDSSTTTGKSWSGQVKLLGKTHNFNGFSSSKSISSSWVKFDDYSDTFLNSEITSDKVKVTGYVEGPSGTSLEDVRSSGSGNIDVSDLRKYIYFNGTKLLKVVFNGSSVAGVIYNGVRVL